MQLIIAKRWFFQSKAYRQVLGLLYHLQYTLLPEIPIHICGFVPSPETPCET